MKMYELSDWWGVINIFVAGTPFTLVTMAIILQEKFQFLWEENPMLQRNGLMLPESGCTVDIYMIYLYHICVLPLAS